jgi:Ion channel
VGSIAQKGGRNYMAWRYVLYCLGCIANVRPVSFSDAFFFSIETLATVGYGTMAPATLYGHAVSAI